MSRIWHALLGAILLGALCVAILPCAAEEKTAPTSGTITGILTAKGENWIEVKADGAQTAERYLPYWRDGGFDKDMLKTVKKLVVPNRVKLSWTLQEHKRIDSVEMLLPNEKTGTLTGQVMACAGTKDNAWVEIQSLKDGKPDPDQPAARYVPRWIGGMPKDGGGLDKAMIETIGTLKPGMTVELSWRLDERLRAVSITVVSGK